MDPSGTINPAALNALSAAATPNTSSTKASPRGIKRSRSPKEYTDSAALGEGEADESKPRKRGRPPKHKTADSPQMVTHQLQMSSPLAVQTPQLKGHHGVSQSSPTHGSPSRATPGSGSKTAVVKALPTVRDHTTDQLGPEGDEYLPREIDDAGEKKVAPNGTPLDGREYRIRTFNVPHRGEKLFMLATECARQLGYRDSYLLFNKNRSLFKIIANQAEKDNLIQQEILPYSYRSRQIAIVTARSMFRQFGSRVINNGRRVRDDYWESKARKQGFTEEDAAGEKRPGAAKQREAAAAEASTANVMAAMPQGEIIYSNGPGLEGPPVPPGIHPVTLAPLSMINIHPDDPRANDFSSIIRPRQEISGPAYVDRSQASSAAEIYTSANQAAEFNKSLTQQRVVRSKYYEDYWKRPHEPPTPPPQPQMPSESEVGTVASQSLQSSQRTHSISNMSSGQHGVLPPQQPGSHMMASQYAPQQPNQHNPMQSPVRTMHQSLPSSQLHQTSPAMSMASMSQRQQTPGGYGYPQGQMWPPPQPQPSPLSQGHHLPQYGQHAQQSPMPPPSQMGGGMGFPQMNPMGNAFPGMNRNMYQPSPSPQHFNMGHQGSPVQQGGMQGWVPPSSSAGLPQDWQRYQ